ncbi:hypothetical protein M0R45_036061 [Rubus argutus]|uniref:MHC class I antigen n=1 Tax=Rubus argutus TaxID=59490 RepID=A0AAW1VUX6_RUBAR
MAHGDYSVAESGGGGGGACSGAHEAEKFQHLGLVWLGATAWDCESGMGSPAAMSGVGKTTRGRGARVRWMGFGLGPVMGLTTRRDHGLVDWAELQQRRKGPAVAWARRRLGELAEELPLWSGAGGMAL